MQKLVSSDYTQRESTYNMEYDMSFLGEVGEVVEFMEGTHDSIDTKFVLKDLRLVRTPDYRRDIKSGSFGMAQ